MKQDITVPEAGESVSSGVLAAWLKADGSEVAEGEDIFEFETEKATLAVPAIASGVLSRQVAEGEDVTVGQVVGVIEVGASAKPPAASGGNGSAPEAPQPAAAQLSPAVRKLIQENGIDPASVEGTGKDGRITKKDVEVAIAKQESSSAPAPAASAAPPAAPPPPPAPVAPKGERTQSRTPMSAIRRTIANNLVQSKQQAAHLTTFNEVDMTHAREMRKQYGEQFEKKHDVRLGYMSFFVKAVCNALQAFPDVNAMLDGTDLVQNHFYDIGIAVSTERGLVVPVLRDVDAMSFAQIESQIRSYAMRARDKKLTPDEMSGGTFTITNGGVFGSLFSTPIPTPPQTAVLGMHSIQQRPMVVNGEIAIRDMMYVALTYDHRVIDGREAVSFLAKVKTEVEDPRTMLLDL